MLKPNDEFEEPAYFKSQLPIKGKNTTSTLAIGLKTGIETSLERVPVQLETFLQYDNPLIVSDFDEIIENYTVFNILPNGIQRDALPFNRHPGTSKDGDNRGWELDAHKNIPGFVKMKDQFLDSKWYIMIDDDTYLFKNNLIQHLKTLDPMAPYYLGMGLSFLGCDNVENLGDGPLFAHGGSGIVLSKMALEKLASVADSCTVQYKGCWGGDIKTALCLRDAGILYNAEASKGSFDGDSIHKYHFKDPCATPFSFHHLKTFEIRLLHDLESDIAFKFGPEATVNMGQLFKWFSEKDPFSTFRDYHTRTLTDNSGKLIEFKYRKGLDLKGQDYNHFESTLDECMLACYQDEKCLSWSYIENENTCWLKDRIPTHEKSVESYSGWFEEKFQCNK